MPDRKGGDVAMRKGKPTRLVALNVSVSSEQIQWIIDQASIEECSMGRIVRQLIDRQLHDAIVKNIPKKEK